MPEILHRPGKKFSNKPFGNPNNSLIIDRKSDKELLTTEVWEKELDQPWQFGNNHPYKLIMRWIEGQNFAVTKVVDGSNKLLYYYCDISSPIVRSGDIFELEDWYLDIIKRPNEEPYIDDEDELLQAIELGYLTPKQASQARKTIILILKMFKKNKINF